jgi:hypothetical protein
MSSKGGILMNADQAYAELEAASKAVVPAPPAAPASLPDMADAPRAGVKKGGALDPQIHRSYLLMRRWTAIFAIALAPILAGASGAPLNPSISHYYYLPGDWTRDLFVGTLCAVGFVLYFYKGYSRTEDWLLSIAGIAAAGVAFFPMADPDNGCTAGWALSMHGVSAATLFLAISAVAWFTSEKTLKLLHDERRKTYYRSVYRLIGALMVAAPVTIFIFHRLSGLNTCAGDGEPVSYAIFFVEAAGISIFAIYWLIKSREIKEIMAQAATPGV